jgi:hypothetical protein
MQFIVENPLTFYSLLALGLGLCLCLFVTLKREIQTGRRKQAVLEAALNCVNTKLAETEERTTLLVAPPPPRAGLNLGTRSQALRMARRGDTPQQIAAALSIPEREVELLLKVQRIVMESPTEWETLQTDSSRAPLEAGAPAPVPARV